VRAQTQPGRSPCDRPRNDEYPNPPMKTSHAGALFKQAAASLGYHPYPAPSANMSRGYVNPDGASLAPCMYCGYCEVFACEFGAKAIPPGPLLPIAPQTAN